MEEIPVVRWFILQRAVACLSAGTLPTWKLFINILTLFKNFLALFINCLTLFINCLTLFINYLTLFQEYLNIFINKIWCYLSNAAYILILHGCFPLVTGLVSHGVNSNLGYCVTTHRFFRYSWMIFQESLKPEEKMLRSEFSHSEHEGAFITDPWRRKFENIWHLTFVHVFLNSRIAQSAYVLSIYVVISLLLLLWFMMIFTSLSTD